MKNSSEQIVVHRAPVWQYAGVVEAAHKLGVHKNTLYQYLSGRIPKALGPEKRNRLKIVTVKKLESI